jgi:hypothetical protein
MCNALNKRYMDKGRRIWVVPLVGQARGMRLGIGPNAKRALLTVLPGVAHLAVTPRAIEHIVTTGGLLGAELIWSAVSRAINTAKRSGGEKVVNQRRQRLFTDHVGTLTANIRKWEVLHREARERAAKLELLSQTWVSDFKELIEEGVVEGVKANPDGVYIRLAPIRIRCDGGRRIPGTDQVYRAGLYEQPPALLWIPPAGPSELRILDPITGACHKHPPVAQGPGGGRPCWGETNEIKRRNEAWAQDLWLSNPRGFINFILGYMANIWDEGNHTRYPPFQAWCRRVDD